MYGFQKTATNQKVQILKTTATLAMKLVIFVLGCLVLFVLLTMYKFLLKPVLTTTNLVMKQVMEKIFLFVQV